jgi:hypothetical protein
MNDPIPTTKPSKHHLANGLHPQVFFRASRRRSLAALVALGVLAIVSAISIARAACNAPNSNVPYNLKINAITVTPAPVVAVGENVTFTVDVGTVPAGFDASGPRIWSPFSSSSVMTLPGVYTNSVLASHTDTYGNTSQAEGKVAVAVVAVQTNEYYDLYAGQWASIPPNFCIAAGEKVNFRTVPTPAAYGWPANYPVWQMDDAVCGAAGDATLSFTPPKGRHSVTVRCGNSLARMIIDVLYLDIAPRSLDLVANRNDTATLSLSSDSYAPSGVQWLPLDGTGPLVNQSPSTAFLQSDFASKIRGPYRYQAQSLDLPRYASGETTVNVWRVEIAAPALPDLGSVYAEWTLEPDCLGNYDWRHAITRLDDAKIQVAIPAGGTHLDRDSGNWGMLSFKTNVCWSIPWAVARSPSLHPLQPDDIYIVATNQSPPSVVIHVSENVGKYDILAWAEDTRDVTLSLTKSWYQGDVSWQVDAAYSSVWPQRLPPPTPQILTGGQTATSLVLRVSQRVDGFRVTARCAAKPECYDAVVFSPSFGDSPCGGEDRPAAPAPFTPSLPFVESFESNWKMTDMVSTALTLASSNLASIGLWQGEGVLGAALDGSSPFHVLPGLPFVLSQTADTPFFYYDSMIELYSQMASVQPLATHDPYPGGESLINQMVRNHWVWQTKAVGVMDGKAIAGNPDFDHARGTIACLVPNPLCGADNESKWSQYRLAAPPNAQPGDGFGAAVALWNQWRTPLPGGDAGAIAAIGAPGSALAATNAGAVYVVPADHGGGEAGSTWGDLVRDRLATNAPLLADDAAAGDAFGAAVAITSNRLVVGAPGKLAGGLRTGGAYVFDRVNDAWVPSGRLTPTNGTDQAGFGTAVALSADEIFVGAPQQDGVGAVYVFRLLNGQWVATEQIQPPALSADARFGAALAVAPPTNQAGPPTLAIGAPGPKNQTGTAGAVWFFRRLDEHWQFGERLTLSNANRWGESVSGGGTYWAGAGMGCAAFLEQKGVFCGPLQGQRGWEVSDPALVVVQTNTLWQGRAALELRPTSNQVARAGVRFDVAGGSCNPAFSGGDRAFWFDVRLIPALRPLADIAATQLDPDDVTPFAFDEHGRLVVKDTAEWYTRLDGAGHTNVLHGSGQWQVQTNALPIGTSAWTRVTVRIRPNGALGTLANVWDIWVNELLVAEDLPLVRSLWGWGDLFFGVFFVGGHQQPSYVDGLQILAWHSDLVPPEPSMLRALPVSGVTAYDGRQTGDLHYLVCKAPDPRITQYSRSNPGVEVGTGTLGAYTITNCYFGRDWLVAYMDSNHNGQFDATEAWGAREIICSTNLTVTLTDPDDDHDDLPDWWEDIYWRSITSAAGNGGASGDPDNDGVANRTEYDLCLKPVQRDTDGDGMGDGAELYLGFDPSLNQHAWGAASLPFTADFEADSYGLAPAGLATNHGWLATDTNTARLMADASCGGAQSLAVAAPTNTGVTFWRYIPTVGSGYPNRPAVVYEDYFAIPLFLANPPPPPTNALSPAAFYINAAGAIVVWNGNSGAWQPLGNRPVTPDRWTRFTLRYTYGATATNACHWALWLDGVQLAANLGFAFPMHEYAVFAQYVPQACTGRFDDIIVTASTNDLAPLWDADHVLEIPAFDADSDQDGLLDRDEVLIYHSNPRSTDTDHDGLADFYEAFISHSSLNHADTDGDGINDYDEVFVYGTNPSSVDTDGDGLVDGHDSVVTTNRYALLFPGRAWMDRHRAGFVDGELDSGTSAVLADSDGDGVPDAQELALDLNPLQADTDSDGMSDGWELRGYLNPLVNDASDDLDGDGCSNLAEFLAGTNPNQTTDHPTVLNFTVFTPLE